MKKTRQKKEMKFNYPKVANILVIIAICWLILDAVSMIFMKDQVLQAWKDAGIEISVSGLALMGLMWLLMAFFAWSINRTIKERHEKVPMWELFILAIVAIFSSRLYVGILFIIASVIYLVNAKKK